MGAGQFAKGVPLMVEPPMGCIARETAEKRVLGSQTKLELSIPKFGKV